MGGFLIQCFCPLCRTFYRPQGKDSLCGCPGHLPAAGRPLSQGQLSALQTAARHVGVCSLSGPSRPESLRQGAPASPEPSRSGLWSHSRDPDRGVWGASRRAASVKSHWRRLTQDPPGSRPRARRGGGERSAVGPHPGPALPISPGTFQPQVLSSGGPRGKVKGTWGPPHPVGADQERGWGCGGNSWSPGSSKNLSQGSRS